MPTAAQCRKIFESFIAVAKMGDRKAVISAIESEIAKLKTKPASGNERFDEFWQSYPRRQGANPRQPAMKSYTKALERGASHDEVMQGVRMLCSLQRADIGTPYIPQAVTWLNQERWRDYNHNTTGKPLPPVDAKEAKRLAAIAENAGFFR